MSQIRQSTLADIPRLRTLWTQAFGDDEGYIDNFFDTYYQPHTVLLLEQDGAAQAMTAWFDTTLVLPRVGEYRTAYLYAVATDPQRRGQGLATRLLAGVDAWMQKLDIPLISTVPAEPSLHNFFARHGFAEYFTHQQLRWNPDDTTATSVLGAAVQQIDAAQYGVLRGQLLCNTPHIALPQRALEYQAGCCRASGGGLYRVDIGTETAALCAEEMEDGQLLVKELLCPAQMRQVTLSAFARHVTNFSGIYRVAGAGEKFGMLKSAFPERTIPKFIQNTAFLGLAFD